MFGIYVLIIEDINIAVKSMWKQGFFAVPYSLGEGQDEGVSTREETAPDVVDCTFTSATRSRERENYRNGGRKGNQSARGKKRTGAPSEAPVAGANRRRRALARAESA